MNHLGDSVAASKMYNRSLKSEWFWDFKGKEDYIDEWLFMSSPFHILLISAAYLLFVLKIGPEFMKNRSPFKLNTVLLLYNAAQVLVSCYVFTYGVRLLWPHIFIQKNCILEREHAVNLAAGIHLYFLVKMSELLDTVFFVLRKKNNQITFLHVYHHTLMMLGSWMTLKYEPTYTTVFLGTINSFVHIIMYSYYGLSAVQGMAKYLWWKKYITSMQLIQFGFIIVQAMANNLYSGCLPSYLLLYAIISNAALFVYLFGDFYVRSYLKNKRGKTLKTSQNGSRVKNKQLVKTD